MISRAIIIISLFLNIYGNAQNKAVMKSPKRVENNKALDTLGYLKTFEANKAEYIGKNFSYLLSKMKKLQPQTIWSVPNSMDSTVVTKSLFRFSDINYPVMNETKMLITWETELPFKTVNFNNQRNKFYFSQPERQFYGSKIVRNILVYR
ncbi:hypothetical protein H3Z85_15325 [Chryseobacterium indologenes]|nr:MULTISPECIES: hypothetical protein [Chryseobacterium]MBF6645187.1 hypothetical protein [Chryseobacterium indologenes]MBU3048078.1 hypothetical protein [Chryseobacterium indologenes]MEB4759463.1 hypothetical protein [Chryseobacterium indologenes]QPQ50771.1 hypothetical protein H3Z85_15325 [Chryseobacterium indologenes]QQQ71141.1 hypothetical protein JHW31_22185 [Chryseobacterium indologenes]